ncbi:hypothetical protein PPL_01260 [Heterostelium album PN500]|uniref:Uncharacterized protein n=1 Tax=Heterostelium pallidum (strain ATCC 26659 / Pp 5 / PN500) TaxID=670386 RepID=D3AYK0_HETP5|nr:hypothetical protein PPL_01260 [Heterostelium album PN500]EFA86027.1 hypothetical protein PPL_01260 [Heterostelium album PN500]|eukprot:XP_020438133.1 hypothetical protein PPL_01260 [Heterostelium album PN500]
MYTDTIYLPTFPFSHSCLLLPQDDMIPTSILKQSSQYTLLFVSQQFSKNIYIIVNHIYIQLSKHHHFYFNSQEAYFILNNPTFKSLSSLNIENRHAVTFFSHQNQTVCASKQPILEKYKLISSSSSSPAAITRK